MIFPDPAVQLPRCLQHRLVVQVQIADCVKAHGRINSSFISLLFAIYNTLCIKIERFFMPGDDPMYI